MSKTIQGLFESKIEKLNSQIARLNKNGNFDEEAANLNKYLCILISGYVEKVFVEKLLSHCEKRCGAQTYRYIHLDLKWTTNLDTGKTEKILEKFSVKWKELLQNDIRYSEISNALDSIYNNRNRIAHGADIDVSNKDLMSWYRTVQYYFLQLDIILTKK